jgi:mTERF domain-containing protein, mitochondrial
MALQLLPQALGAARPSLLLPSPGVPTGGAAATARRAGVAFSLQTNVRLLKPSRRVRRSRDPYYEFDEDEEEEDYGFEEGEDDEGDVSHPFVSNIFSLVIVLWSR